MLGKLAFTNKIVAKTLKQDESRVSRVMGFFAEQLNQEMMKAEHPFIYVKGLGTFTLSLAPIETRLKYMIHRYRETKKGNNLPSNRVPFRNIEKSLLGLRTAILELYGLRRMLKTKRKEIKDIRDADREIKNDRKRKLLPAEGVE